jgi:hypothetical protein
MVELHDPPTTSTWRVTIREAWINKGAYPRPTVHMYLDCPGLRRAKVRNVESVSPETAVTMVQGKGRLWWLCGTCTHMHWHREGVLVR